MLPIGRSRSLARVCAELRSPLASTTGRSEREPRRFIKADQYVSQQGIIAVAWLGGGWLSGEVDKIGLVCLIAKQAFVGRFLCDLRF